MTDLQNTKCGKCKWQMASVVCNGCNEFDKYIPMTNAMKIRSMSDEELAEYFSELIKDTNTSSYSADLSDWLEWLKTEVKGD